jgi:CO/xanthine dehydrogenase FAD-binding subunit
MELVRCTSVFDAERRFAPTFDESVKMTVEADRIILAVGQHADLGFLGPDFSGLRVDRGLIVVDGDSQVTTLPAVYAGGDAVNGPSTVAEAAGAGRRAAIALDASLTAEGTAIRRPGAGSCEGGAGGLLDFDPACLIPSEPLNPPKRAPEDRTVDVEDVATVHLTEAIGEVARCFNCGCVAVSPSDLAPALVALDAAVVTTKRRVAAKDFFAARPAQSTVLDPDEVVTEIHIPASSAGGFQGYSKFRIRQSIDFPIVGVAVWMKLGGTRIEDVRIALGAVAPIPIRATRAEEFIKGKEINEDVAALAGALALEGVRPLAENSYKAQIAKTLVKRAVLAASQRQNG